MKGRIIKDWSKVNLRDPEHLAKVTAAFNFFMKAPDRNKELKTAIQAFTTKGDFPAEVLQVLEKYQATLDYDLGYEQIFDIRDFTGTRESGFEILDTTSGLVFRKLATGEKAEVAKVSGSKVTVTFDKYGGAVGFDKVWLDDGKFWNIEQTAIDFRNKAYAARSAAFYSLIEAIPSSKNVSWQNPTPATLSNTNEGYTASRDANTIQEAANEIFAALKNKGYSVNPNTPLKLLAPYVLRPRIEAAITRLNQPVANSSRQLAVNVQPVYTMMLNSNTSYYVILPGRKIMGGYRMDLTIFNMTDILAYAETVSGFMRYGGGIGDIDQIRRCAIA